MTKFGFKKITQNNWLESDPALKGFVRVLTDGKTQPLTGDEYLSFILRPKLIEQVPIEIQKLFEVARGAMAYGYFFYPLYTLAAEQLFRVADVAMVHKCKLLEAPKSRNTFEKRIDWLIDTGAILKSELSRWEAIREIRNIASHPDQQSIFPPGIAIGFIEDIAKQINLLFSND